MIALDTLALIYWLRGEKGLSKPALEAIEFELDRGNILVSVISAIEVARFVDDGHLSLSMDTRAWLSMIPSIDRVRMVPVDTEIAFRAALLPCDLTCTQRLIVATARAFGCALVTPDAKVRALTYGEAIW